MPHDPYKALYLHIPFCVSRCGYCDFRTRAIERTSPEIDEYIESLVKEIRREAKAGELERIETVYIGGGTPSHIGDSRLSSLLYALSVSINMSGEGFEFSMEANPESLDERIVHDVWALGVNRLSIGVQSFDDDVLATLGRAHDAEKARKAIAVAHERFENVSVDIMCGIPGQSDESLADSVSEAIALGVTHASIYPLTIEEHTPFFNAVLARTMEEPDEDMQAHQMELAGMLLEKAGFERYEVASYAVPGYECRHNCMYWTGKPYLGLGIGAVTMTQNSERRMRICDGNVEDDLDRRQMEAEDLMLGMRMSCGVSDERIAQASPWLDNVDGEFAGLERLGLVIHERGRYRPTKNGWLLGNELFQRLMLLGE